MRSAVAAALCATVCVATGMAPPFKFSWDKISTYAFPGDSEWLSACIAGALQLSTRIRACPITPMHCMHGHCICGHACPYSVMGITLSVGQPPNGVLVANISQQWRVVGQQQWPIVSERTGQRLALVTTEYATQIANYYEQLGLCSPTVHAVSSVAPAVTHSSHATSGALPCSDSARHSTGVVGTRAPVRT